jgi:hypothetical protein
MAATQIFSHIVPFPQSVPAENTISQLELEVFLSLRDRLEKLSEEVANAEATLQARLEAGVSVDPGVHSAELKEHKRRNVSWKEVAIRLADRLKLDGEMYCARVLAATKPTRSVSLEIS